METAVRICPIPYNNQEILCVQANTFNNTIQLGNAQNYPVNHVIPEDYCQDRCFSTVVSPLLNYFFEGCDVSVVTMGQTGTGKTYTLLGPGLHCALSESEHGVIPRFLRQVFMKIAQNRDRTCSLHITWSQICGENVQDLLGAGSVECVNVSEAFELIQLGMSNITPKCAHTLFTVTLEQHWLSENTVQHRISTASFADLASGERMLVMDNNGITQAIPTDQGLIALQRCVNTLTEPYIPFNASKVVPYNHSVLSMLLKDSFGGRAKTVVICCVSPFLRDFTDTYYTLQFALRAQMVKNLVTVNSYTTFDNVNENMDIFGLQFAANQLFKLVSNAEELFQKLVSNGQLPKNVLQQISQWLTLKQECEECLSESSEPHRSLERIEEEIEDSSESSENEVLEEEDTESLIDRLEGLMDSFRVETDKLVCKSNAHCTASYQSINKSAQSSNSEYHSKGARRRRGSIHSAYELSPMLSVNSTKKTAEDSQSENETKESTAAMSFEKKQKLAKNLSSYLQGYQTQINELAQNIKMTENLLQELEEHKDTNAVVKGKIEQRCVELQNEYELARSKMAEAQSQNNQLLQEKYKLESEEIEQKLKDTEYIKTIPGDSIRKIAECKSSLHTSKKQLEKLQRMKRKDEKQLRSLEVQLKAERKSLAKKTDTNKSSCSEKSDKNSLANSIDNTALVVYKNLNLNEKISLSNEDLDGLRHEIRDLRRNREGLLEKRCKIHTKVTNKQIVNDVEERKLLQYEEAIEAIDLAIEYKNGLICGRLPLMQRSHDTDFSILLDVIMKLSDGEMRILLQRYYEKIIDLRSSSKKLEVQVMDYECQNESLAQQAQTLCQSLQRVRLEDDRRIMSLQQDYESKLNLLMKRLAKNGRDMGRVLEHSKHALALHVGGAGKQVDKKSIIARFTQYTHQAVPRQLQNVAAGPQAKVIKEKNKIIIQQRNK